MVLAPETADNNPWDVIGVDCPLYEAPQINIWNFWRPVMIDLWDFTASKSKKRHFNLAIVGNTFTGKSTFLENVIAPLKQRLQLTDLEFLEQDCSSNMTLSGLYKKILDFLNWPYPPSANKIEELEKRLIAACQTRKLKYIVIDEFSQLYSNKPTKQASLILKALRNIPQQTGVKICIVGTWKLVDLLKRDAETMNRYPLSFFPIMTLDDKGLLQLRNILATLDKDVKVKTGLISTFHSNTEAISKMYQYGNGRLGAIIYLYERAITEAWRDNRRTTSVSYLDEVYEQSETKNILADNDAYRIQNLVEMNLDKLSAKFK